MIIYKILNDFIVSSNYKTLFLRLVIINMFDVIINV